jgi:hypothetical protein
MQPRVSCITARPKSHMQQERLLRGAKTLNRPFTFDNGG